MHAAGFRRGNPIDSLAERDKLIKLFEFASFEVSVPKRIILLLDGTWNDAETGLADTNIVRLREIIAKSLDSAPIQGPADAFASGSSPQQFSVTARNYSSGEA